MGNISTFSRKADKLIDVFHNSGYPISGDLLMDGYLRICESELNIFLPEIAILLINLFRFPKHYKILMTGDHAVGKTSIVKRYIYKQYDEYLESTIGTDIESKRIQIKDQKLTLVPLTIDVQLWQFNRFVAMTPEYYSHVVASVIVMDITNKETFYGAQKWKLQLDKTLCLQNGESIPVVLFVNKWDLILDNPALRQVTDNAINELCIKYNFIGWFTTSAKSGLNVKKGFSFMISKIVQNQKNHVIPMSKTLFKVLQNY